MKKNVKLDALLLHAALHDLFVPCAIGLHLTPDEAFGRSDWLRKQKTSYIQKVIALVMEIENETHP
jgi:hypothetical protein